MLPTKFRLKKKQDFKRAFRLGKKFRGKYGMLIAVPNGDAENLLFGAVITKKIGNAVTRNKFKRRLMSIFEIFLKNGYESGQFYFVYVAFEFCEEFEPLKSEFLKQLEKATV